MLVGTIRTGTGWATTCRKEESGLRGKRKIAFEVGGILGPYSGSPRPTWTAFGYTPEGTLNYTYDNAGNLLTLGSANAGGSTDTYTYDVLNRLSTVLDSSGTTTYAYDKVGNLQSFAYPNGVATTYNYDSLNRLTQMGSRAQSTQLASYTYTLGLAGNRTSVAELSGRTVAYGYDSLCRLTSETISSDPNSHNGTTQYQYHSVGNRQQLIVNGVTANTCISHHQVPTRS